MSDIALRVEHLAKRYTIGARTERYVTLRDQVAGALGAPARSLGRALRGAAAATRPRQTEFWALQDVSFEVKKGEVVGVIGRNGAGKSTLLKVLSRITKPTRGRAELYGRAGSLLEVGTGFHPELDGRENIYLNGAILGMRRDEIARKFDEIVAFADVEAFIDTPVKRYSSGMYVRLAFAVAAHLEPEILLVDEVLAVGDAAFQSKCLGKLGEVARQGRTVLFVSHNLGQLRNFCASGLWLDGGRLQCQGSITDTILRYQQSLTGNGHAPAQPGAHQSHFVTWQVESQAEMANGITGVGPVSIGVELFLAQPVHNATAALVLQTTDGLKIAGWAHNGLALPPGAHTLVFHLADLPVRSGIYEWYVSLWDGASRIDAGVLHPAVLVSKREHSRLSDEWAGILSVPCQLEVKTAVVTSEPKVELNAD